MKRFLMMAVMLACVLSMCVFPAAAEEYNETLDQVFERATAALDTFYELDGEYMATRVVQMLYSWEEMEQNEYAPKVMSADEVEAVLYRYFAPTDQDLERFRNYLGYNAAQGTYSLEPWGGMGGVMSERDYIGYSVDGDIYSIYWQTVEYAFLADVLPEGTDEWTYAESLGYPPTIEYDGQVYEAGMDGYYRLVGYLDYGNVYTATYLDGVVRLLSKGTFTTAELPVFKDIPADSGVSIDVGDAFVGGTTVTVTTGCTEPVMDRAAAAVEEIARVFAVYDLSAKKDGETVQPNGTIEVTFALPEGFSTDVSVYYMDEDGQLEQQTATVDTQNRTVTAQLSHFSIYLLADHATAPVEETEPIDPTDGVDPTDPAEPETNAPESTDAPTEEPKPDADQSWIIFVVIAVVAVVAAAVVLIMKKKKN